MYTNIKIDNNTAMQIYPTASAEIKKLLEQSFPAGYFLQKITDRVKTYEDACNILGKDPVKNLPYASPADEEEEAINAVKQAYAIQRAINGQWKADYSNRNQKKYYAVYFWDDAAGCFRFDYAHYECTFASTRTGVRHVFETAEHAQYFATQFISIINKFLTQKTNTNGTN